MYWRISKSVPTSNEEVVEKLRINFDIAFFFIGIDLEDITTILEHCGHYADIVRSYVFSSFV